MRVLVVNTVYERGGAAGIAQTLHRELNRLDGWESLFAYGRGPKGKEVGAIRFSLQPEVYFHTLLTRMSGIQNFGTWLSTKRLIRLIKQWKPNVIHFHNIHGYYLDLSIAKAVGNLGIPIVWTLHDGWSVTGRCAYLSECDRWKNGCGHCPDLSRYLKAYLDTSAFMWRKKKAAFTQGWNPIIICPSQWLAHRVKESYLDKFCIEVIYNGIDTEIFRPQEKGAARKRLGLPLNKKIVLFAAADLREERKGTRYFFETFNCVEAEGWMAVTVGKMIDLPRSFESRAEIRQLGYLPGAEAMAAAYSAADLFCITSLDDNFPTTVIESMSCGTPVVGFSVGGIPEQVTEDCGQLVPPRDLKSLRQAIIALLDNDELLRTMGARCRERAIEEYNLERFLERHLAIYHDLGRRSRK